MPLMKCSKDGKSGWKYGDGGHCYTGPGAKKAAIKQGIAIDGPNGFKHAEGVEMTTEAEFEEVYSELSLAEKVAYNLKKKKKKEPINSPGPNVPKDNPGPYEMITENMGINEKDMMMTEEDKKACAKKSFPERMFEAIKSYISKKERDKIPKEDFGDPENEKFPIRNQNDLDSAAKLIGKAADPEKVKQRIIKIAKRKGLTLPASWQK